MLLSGLCLNPTDLVLNIMARDIQSSGRTMCLIQEAFHGIFPAFTTVGFDVIDVRVIERPDCSITNRLCDMVELLILACTLFL